MKKEIHLPTGRAEINVNSTGASVAIDGFKATIAQLRMLGMRGRNIRPDASCGELGVTRNTYNLTLKNLIDVNTDDFIGKRPTLDRLAETANKHELLYPLSIIGIEELSAEMRKSRIS